MGRRAARGGEVEVTELDPKSSTLLPMWSLSIMEAFLTSNTSRNSLEQRFHRCEQTVHTPSRHHHACAVRRVGRRPGSALPGTRKRCTGSTRENFRTDGAQLRSMTLAVVYASVRAANDSVYGSPSLSAEGCINTPHTDSALHDVRKRSTSNAREKVRNCGAQLH